MGWILWLYWFQVYNNYFDALIPPSIQIANWSGHYGFPMALTVHFVMSFGQHSHARRGSFWRCLLRSALSVRLALTRWAAACVSMSGMTSLLDSAAWQPTLITHQMDRMRPPAAGQFLWRSQPCIKHCAYDKQFYLQPVKWLFPVQVLICLFSSKSCNKHCIFALSLHLFIYLLIYG